MLSWGNLPPRRSRVSPVLIQFEEIEIDLGRYQLRRSGRPVRLERLPMELLILLASKQGQLVSREEIIEKLWGKGVYLDTEHGINSAMRKIRMALHDDPQQPRFVETVVGKGYRFAARVTEVPPPPPVETVHGPIAQEPTAVPRVLAAVLVAAVLLLLLIGAALLNPGGWRERFLPHRVPARIQSLAVLPLENLSGDPQQEYFSDGITEALITELAKLRGLRVTSRASVMRYKHSGKAVPEMARELNVDAVLEGAVVRSGNKVRITVQLIEAATDKHRWAAAYERELGDILALQAEIAGIIAREIALDIPGSDRASPQASRPVEAEAYEAYLKGLFHFYRRPSLGERDISIQYLERATSSDPQFAPAHAALAKAYVDRFFSEDPRKEWEERAFVEIEKAISLDPNLGDAYVARGDLAWTLANHFPHERAIRDYARALALNPNVDDAHSGLGEVYAHIGLLEKGLQHLKTEVERNPQNLLEQYVISRVYLYQQRYEEVLAQYDRHPELPRRWQGYQALALGYMGRRAEALSILKQLSQEFPMHEDVASAYAVMLAADGDRASAKEQIRAAIRFGEGKSHFHHAEYNIASAYALMGRPREALDWLQKTANEGMPCYPLFEKDPNLNSLRNDREFAAFLVKIKSQWEQFKATL